MESVGNLVDIGVLAEPDFAFNSSSLSIANLLSLFFSFRFLYYRLPIDRVSALLLMRHRSTID